MECRIGVDEQEVRDRALVAFGSFEDRVERAVFEELGSWCADRSSSPIALLRLIEGSDKEMEWLRYALMPIHQTMVEAVKTAAFDVKEAEAFSEGVEEWLDLLEFSGGAVKGASVLRMLAFCTLYDGRRIDGAKEMLGLLSFNMIEISG